MNADIVLSSIAKSYQAGERLLPVLHDISLDIESGESVAIMGPSGSGKSTLLHIMGALDYPTAGRVMLAGRDLSRLSETELARLRNREIGFVFQNFFLLPYFSILENVCLPSVYRGADSDGRKTAADLLRRLGLGDRLHHKPHALSGGERQRAAIARALINSPRIIFADEPTGSLDTATGDSIMDLLLEINQSGTTLIVITHDPRVAKRANRIIHIADGRLLA